MKISKLAIKRYIEFLEELLKADPISDSIEFNLGFPQIADSTSLLEATKNEAKVIREIMASYAEMSSEPQVMAYIVAPRETARQALKARLRNAETLAVYDPYFFNIPQNKTKSEYIKEFASVLPANSLRFLEICHRGMEAAALVQKLRKQLPRHVTLHVTENKSIHDRVWIVNGNRAFVVGTSFGGIGKKIAFILDLPDEDLLKFKHYVRAQKN